MMTYKALEQQSADRLEAAGVFPGHARFLMLEMLASEGKDMFLLFDEPVADDFATRFEANVEKLTQHIPVAQILGYQWFYGYQIMVNEHVLTPREETEELVGEILMYVDDHFENPKIVDVATGSGAIGITLSMELDTPVLASDISEEALDTARLTNEGVGSNVTFIHSDMLDAFIERKDRFDILVCNPPYIKAAEVLEPEVIDHEPHIALFGGDDGLFFYRRVLNDAHKILNDSFLIAFEIGFDIGEGVVALAKEAFPNADVILKQDMNGLDRMVFVLNV